MLRKEDLLKEISDNLSILEVSLQNRSDMRLYDENILAESFFASFLNIMYDYNLINLNTGNKNHISIDLGDKSKRVTYQVTTTKTSEKIIDTIEKFIGNSWYNDYDELFILIMGKKQKKYNHVNKRYPQIDPKKILNFDPDKHILDFPSICLELPNLSINKLEELVILIRAEFKNKCALSYSDIHKQSDSEALQEYREFFDRPALQDSFNCEGNFTAFETALTELIELLKNGSVKQEPIAKPIKWFENQSIKKELDNIYEQIRSLRQLYVKYKNKGEIDPERNQAKFKSMYTYQTFDSSKKDIIDRLNQILIEVKIDTI